MHDYYSGLDGQLSVSSPTSSIDGVKAGENLAKKFRPTTQGVWELKLQKAITHLPKGKITISVKDHQGNRTDIERTFSVR